MKPVTKHVEILSAFDPAAPTPPEPPDQLRLFAAGKNETTKGTFLFTAESAKSVMAAAGDYGNDMCFDYGHAMVGGLSIDPAEAGKAAGWYRLEARDGLAGPELWAVDIRWTPPARAKIMNREYRYLSPAFYTDGENQITEYLNAALTNIPATKRMKPIVASKEDPMLKTLAEKFKSTEADFAGELEKFVALTGKASIAEAAAVVMAWREASAKVAEMQAALSKIEADKAAAERDALVRDGQTAGKIPPALVEWAKAQSVESLKAFIAAAPAMVQTAPVQTPAPADKSDAPGVSLSAAEKALCKSAGVDPAKMLARKIERIAIGYPGLDKDDE